MTDLGIYEQGTESFTSAEMHAIFDFESAVTNGGLRDCFDSSSRDLIREHQREHGERLTRDMLREYAKMLNLWYLALDQLLADILTCTDEVTRYSTAARRYIATAASDYHRTRQDFEHAVTAWSLGLLTEGVNADYPPATRSVDYTMQALTGE